MRRREFLAALAALGVRVRDLPLTQERIVRAINA